MNPTFVSQCICFETKFPRIADDHQLLMPGKGFADWADQQRGPSMHSNGSTQVTLTTVAKTTCCHQHWDVNHIPGLVSTQQKANPVGAWADPYYKMKVHHGESYFEGEIMKHWNHQPGSVQWSDRRRAKGSRLSSRGHKTMNGWQRIPHCTL